MNRNLFSPTELADFETAMKKGNNQYIERLFQKAADYFHHEEIGFREEALKKFNIPGELKREPEQIIAQSGRIAIFSMAQSNHDAVQRIYEGTNHNPIMKNLEAPDAYTKGKKVYFQTIEALMEKVPSAIDKILQ